MKKIILLFFCVLTAFSLRAQIQVTPNITANNLVHTLVGQGFSFSNATLNCPNGASGIFGNGISSMGLDSGIVLSTGPITSPFALNSVATNFNSTDQFGAGDADLENYNVATTITHDACALEFDVIPICDTLRFSYVFASEEYPEFVNDNICDAFAFFISGPGITGVQDIAFIPSTSTLINIDNINMGNFNCPGPITGCTNCAYYVENCTGNDFIYDGYTTILPAEIIVSACSTYHVKLVIADGSDGVWDSGVFLKKGTLSCFGIGITASTTGSTGIDAIEGCQAGQFQMCLSQAPDTNFMFHFSIGGSATYGVDYIPIADSIEFPAHVACVTLDVFPYVDTLAEVSESIKIYYQPNACGGMDSAFINILDIYQVNAGSDVSICPGDSIQIGPSFVPGTTYSWTPSVGMYSDSDTIARPWVHPMNLDTVPLIIHYGLTTSIGGCSNSDTLLVTVTPYPAPQAGPDTNFCSGQFTIIGTPVRLGHTYSWTPNNGLTNPLTSQTSLTLTNTTNAPVNHTYILTTNWNSCVGYDTAIVTVNPMPTADAGSDRNVCADASIQIGGPVTTGYVYAWSPPDGLSSVNAGNPNLTLSNSTSSPQTHIYVLQAGYITCSDMDSVTVTVTPLPVSNAGSDITVCPNESQTIGAPAQTGYSYSWLPVTGLTGSNTSNPSVNLDNLTSTPEETPFIVLTNQNDCISRDTVVVTTKGKPVSVIKGTPDTICLNMPATVLYDGAAMQSPKYQWNFGNGKQESGTLAGPYKVSWNEVGEKAVSLIVSEYDCPSSPDSISIIVIDCSINPPNIVTPNGDGENDFFHIVNMERNPNSKLVIYNRWGKEVYKTDFYKNDWNGGTKISAGVYYYVLIMVDGTEKHGFLTIVK